MNGLVGINIEIERNWTWVYGSTYPVKEELKQQGFLWSVKRRAWYNRSIVEVKINGNGHGTVKEAQHTKEDAQQTKNTIEMVKVRVLKEVPTFMGTDGKTYELKEGVTDLPKENAEVLIKRGVVTKEIESKSEKKKGLTTTERNRAIKKVLSKEFGAKNVHVIGDKGTAYGWVKVLITLPVGFEIKTQEGRYTEEAGDYIDEKKRRVIRVLKDEGLWEQLWFYYSDMNDRRKEILIDVKLVEGAKQQKTLEEEVLEYMKTKLNGAEPLVSGEWLSKQEKLGKTFLQLKPQIDNLIEDSLETEKRVKESEKEKDLHDWAVARNKELREAENIKDPHERIEKVNEIVRRYEEKADKNWVISEQYAAQIRVQAKREIKKTKQGEELSEHDKALLEGNYKIEGKPENKETETKINEHEEKPAEESNEHEISEYEKTVNKLKERFGMLNPM